MRVYVCVGGLVRCGLQVCVIGAACACVCVIACLVDVCDA